MNIKEGIMKKVLSTKLEVDELDRFTVKAKQQGESKAGLLRRLALDCINSGGKVDREESVGRPQPTVPAREDPQLDKTNQSAGISRCTNSLSCKSLSNEGLHSKNFISVHHQHPTGSATAASVTSSLSDTAKADHGLDLPPSSKESLPVYRDDSKGRPEVSTKSTTGKGLLLSIFLLSLWLKYGPSPAIDRKYSFTI